MSVKLIEESDWEGILKVQAGAYEKLGPEALEVLKCKWRNLPAANFVHAKDKVVDAYLIAHSWNHQVPPKLHTLLPENIHGSILLLHDLAVSNTVAGLGVGSKLVAHLFNAARLMKFAEIRLVSLRESVAFWQKMGFVEDSEVDACPGYGSGAKVMYRVLSACTDAA